jgi:hypothetical protein
MTFNLTLNIPSKRISRSAVLETATYIKVSSLSVANRTLIDI